MAQTVKRLPTMWETQVQSLGGEDPLVKEMATHYSIIAWRIPWIEELGGLPSMGCKELDMTERLRFTLLSLFRGLVAQLVKNLPSVQEMEETWVQFLGGEDPLVKEMATHSSILARRILWTEEPGGLPSMGSQRVRHD